MSPNYAPYKIKPHERGHRKRVMPGEESATYWVQLRASTVAWLKKQRTARVRDLLEEFRQITEDEERTAQL